MATDNHKRQRRHSPPATGAAAYSSSTPPATAYSSSTPPATASPWPFLPPDLLPAIGRCLTSLEDFFFLRGSCRAYRAMLPPSRSVLASQPPLLLISLFLSSAEVLFHLSLRRVHSFRLPWGHLPASRVTLFFSHGFLVTATNASTHYPPKLLLLHIFSGEQLRLPKVPAPFTRILLSDDLLTVLFLPGRPMAQFCRPGDALWRLASADAPHVLDDLLFVDGTLYALVGLRLATVELSESSLELSFLGGDFDEQSRPAGERFMLGECDGDVLLISVEHWVMGANPVYRVFRWESEKGKWVMVTSLGGRTVFLGYSEFAACIGPDCAGIRGDCLYISGPRSGEWYEYYLVDGTCDVRYAEYPGAPPLNNRLSVRPPVWVFPSLC